MRKHLFVAAFLALLLPSPAPAEDAPPGIKGIYLLTDYPASTVRPGTTSTVNLRLQNYGMPPERFALSVKDIPSGWTATLLGGGQPVAAAMPTANSSVSLDLRLDIPKDAKVGSQSLTVLAQGETNKVELPVTISLANELPAKLSLQPQLPELRGTSKSNFDYQLSVKNDSGKRLVISLGSTAPQNFDATFTEMYGSQELSAIPVEAGQSKDVKLKVRPPTNVKAGHYDISVQATAEDAKATTQLALNITGQPKLDLSGREGLLSARATAGTETSIPIVVTNSGTARAEQVQLSGSAPSGWKVTFDPKLIDAIAPGEQREVQALITPVSKAIAGDYATTLRADARGESASQTFRVAVTTSTVWGVAGFGIIGIALLVLVGAVARFGRR
jgi:uncharacterized membrane protein